MCNQRGKMEKCPKCNGKDISVRYFREDDPIYWVDSNSVADRWQFMISKKHYEMDRVKKEHLVFTCKECGYEQATETKDNQND